jgi:hypothetical protein
MKSLLMLILTWYIFLCVTAFADKNPPSGIKVGMSAKMANDLMLFYKFDSSPLQMSATENNKLLFFSVGPGVLILTYSPNEDSILRMDYNISSDGPKSRRVSLYLKVNEFTPKTKNMVIDLSE